MLGDGSVNQPSYTMTQSPACGYEETITADSFNFLTHNALTRDFTISTDAKTDVDTHMVTVRGSIQVPDDYTMTTFTEASSVVIFYV